MPDYPVTPNDSHDESPISYRRSRIRETSGPTNLLVGDVADGEYLKRDGETIVGAAGGGGGGSGDVVGPASATDEHLAVFDGATGKLIKDGGAVPAVPVKASGAEIDTGTDDVKFATAKALVDSAYAKTTDITAAAVGLGNVDDTSDAAKPVSSAQQTALDLKADKGAIGSSGLTQATNKLLGRGTAGTGAPEEITLGTNLSLTGTTLNAAGGGIAGSTGATDNAILRADGTGGATAQGSTVTVSDTGGVAGVPSIGNTTSGNLDLGLVPNFIVRVGTNGFYPLITNSVDLGFASGGFSWKSVTLTNIIQFESGGTISATIRRGAGSPEGAITANVGSLYLRTDGGANTTLYVKESGTGNTGWIAK